MYIGFIERQTRWAECADRPRMVSMVHRSIMRAGIIRQVDGQEDRHGMTGELRGGTRQHASQRRYGDERQQ